MMAEQRIIDLDKVGELVQELVNEAYARGDKEFTFTIPLQFEGKRKVQISYFPMNDICSDETLPPFAGCKP